MTDQGGHNWTAINDSDHEVIVAVATHDETSVRIPAHVHMGLSGGWWTPEPGWGLTVYDASCHVLATMPTTAPQINLYIGPDGAIDLSHDREFSGPLDSGERFVAMADLQPATCS